MKKSLLVVPAMGVLLLAAAGSVGGTVAWFSSVSSVEAAANNFVATRIDGNLSVQFAAGNGTELINSADASKGVTVKNDGQSTATYHALTHASFDYSDKKVYTISSENAQGVREISETFVSGQSGPKQWLAREDGDLTKTGNQTVYYAVSWTMTFTYDFATEEKVNLYFDVDSTLTNDNTGGSHNTETGFRIAFVGETSTNGVPATRVWAKKQAVANCKYVETSNLATDPTAEEIAAGLTTKAKKNQAGFAYPAGIVIGSDTNAPTGHDEGAIVNSMTGATYLGQFSKPGSAEVSNLVFTCVAWYEGTDPNISPDSDVMSALSAGLKFYAREYRAPANNG